MIRKVSAKRLWDIASGKVRLGHNSTMAVTKPKPKEQMTIEQLKASGLLQMARALDNGPKAKTERQKWKAKADKWFSEFIRLRDSDANGIVKCVTCSHTNHWRYLQCGHYVTRGHEATRFDEMNCTVQCRGCNYNGGQHLKHAVAIDDRYGDGASDTLEAKGRMKCKRDADDYEAIATHYKWEVDRIKATEPQRYFGRP